MVDFGLRERDHYNDLSFQRCIFPQRESDPIQRGITSEIIDGKSKNGRYEGGDIFLPLCLLRKLGSGGESAKIEKLPEIWHATALSGVHLKWKRGVSRFFSGREMVQHRTENDRAFNSLINDHFHSVARIPLFRAETFNSTSSLCKFHPDIHSSKNGMGDVVVKMTPAAFMVYTIFYDSIA